jgi:hypothetical protein
MTFHGGNVLSSTVTYAIFWGSRWSTDPTFVGDKISGMTSFFQGIGNTGYLNILHEYSLAITPQSTWMGYYVDAGREPPQGEPGTQGVQNEVCAVLGDHQVTPRSDAVYVVYDTATSQPLGYDGWHNHGTCQGTPIYFALVLNTDWYNRTGDNGSYHSIRTASLADVSAHEMAETISDPSLNAWYTQNLSGEVADKCNGSYATANPYVTFSNGSNWKIQGEWSNDANTNSYGFANGNTNPVEYGCVTNRVQVGPVAISGALSGSNPAVSWTAPAISYGTASNTVCTLYRTTLVNLNYVDQDDPISTNCQTSPMVDLNRTVVRYNGTTGPGPHYDQVWYYMIATNQHVTSVSSRVYFTCGALGHGCGQ